MSLATATAAPSPIEIGTTTYHASPLTLSDLGALEERLKALVIASAVRAGQDLPEKLREQVIDRALFASIGVTFRSAEMAAYLKTVQGAVSLICLSICTRHPDVDEKAIAKTLVGNA